MQVVSVHSATEYTQCKYHTDIDAETHTVSRAISSIQQSSSYSSSPEPSLSLFLTDRAFSFVTIVVFTYIAAVAVDFVAGAEVGIVLLAVLLS